MIGTGSKPNGIAGRISYWMKISEVVTFDEYWIGDRFRRKRALMNGSMIQRYGDNIYRREGLDGSFSQADSFHSNPDGTQNQANLLRDTGRTERVLVASEFAFWGRKGPLMPPEFGGFVHGTQGHKCNFCAELVASFSEWILGQPDRGWIGNPANWPSC